MTIRDRINDPGYQKVLSDMIDEFYHDAGDAELGKIFHAEAPSDMVEVMIRYLEDDKNVEKSLVTMFVLGVYMAHKDIAILPSTVQ